MKPWTAKFLVAMAILVPLGFFFGACASDPKTGGGPFGQSAAAWAQAMGSVGAICAAIYAAYLPIRERQREVSEARAARSSFVADRIVRAAGLIGFITHNAGPAEMMAALTELHDVASMLRTFSTDTEHQVSSTYADFASTMAMDSYKELSRPQVRIQDMHWDRKKYENRAELLASMAHRLLEG